MNIYFELFLVFFKIGLFTFGGGYAMLPMLEKEIVEKKSWATEEDLMKFFAIGQVTPGVIAVNTATFIGYYKKGVLGGIVSTLGVISPSLLIISIIANILNNFSEILVVQHALNGIRIAVCILMCSSIFKLLKGSVNDLVGGCIFIFAFILSYFTNISTVVLVFVFAIFGLIIYLNKFETEFKK